MEQCIPVSVLDLVVLMRIQCLVRVLREMPAHVLHNRVRAGAYRLSIVLFVFYSVSPRSPSLRRKCTRVCVFQLSTVTRGKAPPLPQVRSRIRPVCCDYRI